MAAARKQGRPVGSSSSKGRPRGSATANDRRSGRDVFLFLIFAFLAVILLGRLAFVQIIKAGEYSQAASDQRTRDIELPARRGTIYDRNGSILATTVDATTIYANPHEVADPQGTAEQLAAILGGDAADYTEKLSRTDVSFVYIARKADKGLANSVKALHLSGIEFIDDSKRVYPYNEIGGQVIGFVGVDDQGLSGLELEYNDVLSGASGELLVERGAGGIPIAGGVESEIAAEDGEDIIISIDLELQQYVEQVLSSYVEQTSAESGGIVVYDATTGEIYASASSPLLDPNNYQKSSADAFSLKTVSSAFEPGSTFKSITAAAVIDSGTVKAETTFDVPASLTVADHVIKDAYEHGDEVMTFREILENSSNIGTVLASRTIGDEAVYNYIKRFKFGEDCGIDFPGASAGILANYENWSLTQSANVPFGQGISVSMVQLARAYGVFADNGTIATPHFLLSTPHTDDEKTWPTESVLSPATVDAVTDILESVVSEGTAGNAQVAGYTVAGKTGTAQRADSRGSYQSDAYTIDFAGYFSKSSSNLVCVTYLENPTMSSATLMFSDVMTFVAERYRIAPG